MRSRKNELTGKRVLSLLLTLAVILCSIAAIPVRATSTVAEETPYNIGWGSPAIPMYENKYLDLKKTTVQFEKDGEYTNGGEIEWSINEANTPGESEIILDNSNKILMTFSSGKYILNAVKGNKNAKIYVLVNKQGEEEFILDSSDFRTENFDAEKWYSGRHGQLIDNYYINGCAYTYQSKAWYTAKSGRMYIGGGNGGAEPLDYGNPLVMYDSEILNDFADYTVSAKIVLENSWGEDASSRPNFSIVARGKINKADRTEGENVLATDASALFLTLRGYGGLCVLAKSPTGTQELGTLAHGDTLYTPSAFESDEAAVAAISQGGEYTTAGHKEITRAVEMTLLGNDIRYMLDGQVVFDSKAGNSKYFRFNETNEQGMSTATTGEYTAYETDMANLNTEKGTIGFATGRRIISVLDFKVTLNIETMPKMSNIYYIKNTHPAIPMYAGTAVETDDLFIEFEDGTYKTGNYLNWQLDFGDNTMIDTTNGYLIAVKEGISSYTVTSGSKSSKVYVIVNEKGNNEFVLENIDFTTDGFNAEKWYSGRHGKLWDNYYLKERAYVYMAKPWYTARNNKMYLGGYDGGTNPLDYNNTVAMYDSEILKDFADYTITAKVALENTYSEDLSSRPNFSIVARGNINKANRSEGENVFESGNSALFLTLRGYGGLCVLAKSPTGTQELGTLAHGDTLYTPSAFESDEAAVAAISQGGEYTTAGHIGIVREIEMKLSDDDIRYTLDGQVIFDSEAEGNKYLRFGVENENGMSTSVARAYSNYDTDITAMNTGKGTIGFATGRRYVSITECKVTLNVDKLPTAVAAPLTVSELVAEYRSYTDSRISEILTATPKVTPNQNGRSFYFSNNGSPTNSGTSEENAISDLSALSKLGLKSGDTVYFECGSVWRKKISVSWEGVTFTSYGTGEKPKFYGSPENAATSAHWNTTDTENVYVYYKTLAGDVGTLVFDEGAQHGIKHIPVVKDEKSVDHASGEDFATYKDLKQNFDFYHDVSKGLLYLYYDNGNPGANFNSIELCTRGNIFAVNANNVTIDNLCIRYGGSHGIGSSASTGLTVRNCEIGWIGGSIQSTNYTSPTRFGNGVEVWESAYDFTVDNNYFYQIYDAAATFQYTGSNSTMEYRNIKFINNVMDYCNYSIEYFLSNNSNTASAISDVEFSNNLMWYAGEGFSSQRPDKTGAHIKSWGHGNRTDGNFVIKNNLFAFACDVLVETYSKYGVSPQYSNNTYIQFASGKLGRTYDYGKYLNFEAQYIEDYFKEKDAKVIVVK